MNRPLSEYDSLEISEHMMIVVALGEKQHEVLFEHPPGLPSEIVGVGLDREHQP